MADQTDTIDYTPYQRVCHEHLDSFRGQPITIVGQPIQKIGELHVFNMQDGGNHRGANVWIGDINVRGVEDIDLSVK